MNQPLFENFLVVAKKLNDKFGISPLLYGSLGLEILTGKAIHPKDIDLLIPLEFIRERWGELRSELEDQGYKLIDANEHEFSNGHHKIGFSFIEDLEKYAGIKINEIEQRNYKGIKYRLLNLIQYHRVYSRSVKDGYRIHTRNKKDAKKIELIEEILKEVE
ncbi:hypothetical protein [Saccharibacillus kuerlensis]|uniref:Nucleotidyltransferase family protein n=1 Tax=Saccharibacillus kuerlensis TaxID=459527 RepID=A0ABQ2KRX3_9BACL|nr:hypothetical protein [Saccharibacillus kuerlensis]GGN91480.1 hypothetical protein GCM10010969_03210 [Saccharibacillus kuerlensis]